MAQEATSGNVVFNFNNTGDMTINNSSAGEKGTGGSSEHETPGGNFIFNFCSSSNAIMNNHGIIINRWCHAPNGTTGGNFTFNFNSSSQAITCGIVAGSSTIINHFCHHDYNKPGGNGRDGQEVGGDQGPTSGKDQNEP